MLAVHVLLPKLRLHFCRPSCSASIAHAASSSSSSSLPFPRHHCAKPSTRAAATPGKASSTGGKDGRSAKSRRRGKPKLTKKSMAELLRKHWLHTLSPAPLHRQMERGVTEEEEGEACQDLTSAGGAITTTPLERIGNSLGSCCVLGVDPDVYGALAVLRTDTEDTSAEVFDVPVVQIMIGNKRRHRHDVSSIVELIKQVKAPHGSLAYIEQNSPQPQNGKQAWWGSGFGFGIWLGALVSLGITVIPVSSVTWKQTMGLTGSKHSKDDSRIVAGLMFPLLLSKFKRKKDHGRAEAILIAAFGKGIPVPLRTDTVQEENDGPM